MWFNVCSSPILVYVEEVLSSLQANKTQKSIFHLDSRLDPAAYQLYHAEAYYHGEIPYPPPPMRKLSLKDGD